MFDTTKLPNSQQQYNFTKSDFIQDPIQSFVNLVSRDDLYHIENTPLPRKLIASPNHQEYLNRVQKR